MIILAHIMGMPVEEVLVPLSSGAGAAAAIWLAVLQRRAAPGLPAADFLKRRWKAPLDADEVAAVEATSEGIEPPG